MATPTLTPQNFYSTTLSANIGTSDTTVYLNGALPSGNEGYLEIGEGLSTKEIVYFTSKGSNFVTLPSVGAGRGVGGTSAAAHSAGEIVKMKLEAEWWKALQDGTALAAGAITATKLGDIGAQSTIVGSGSGETTTSAPYVDLTTAGPADTVTIRASGMALVTMSAEIGNNAAGNISWMGFAVSGATTVAAIDDNSVSYQAYANNAHQRCSGAFIVTGLTPGSNIFTAKYRVDGNTGSFKGRRIGVLPL